MNPLPSESHNIKQAYRDLFDPRECICQVCGCIYEVWSAPSELWNEVVDEHGRGYLCPNCFTHLARVRGVGGTWILVRDGEPDDILGFLTERWPDYTESVRKGLDTRLTTIRSGEFRDRIIVRAQEPRPEFEVDERKDDDGVASFACFCGAEGWAVSDEMSNYIWVCPSCDRRYEMFAPSGVPWFRIFGPGARAGL